MNEEAQKAGNPGKTRPSTRKTVKRPAESPSPPRNTATTRSSKHKAAKLTGRMIAKPTTLAAELSVSNDRTVLPATTILANPTEASTAIVTQTKRGTKRPLRAKSPPIITLSPSAIKKGCSKKLKPEVNPTGPQPEPENSTKTWPWALTARGALLFNSQTGNLTNSHKLLIPHVSTLPSSASKASTASSVASTVGSEPVSDEPVAGSSKGNTVEGNKRNREEARRPSSKFFENPVTGGSPQFSPDKKRFDLGKNVSSKIFFNCPTIGVQKLREVEMQRAIFKYLLQQPYDASGKVQSLMILSCNTPEEKVALCVSALSKHLNDIISTPGDPDAKIISCTSEFYKQSMADMLGLLQFLRAAGYTLHLDAYKFEGDAYKALDHLKLMKESLENTVPIQMELDRNLQVVQPGKELGGTGTIGPRTPGPQNRAHRSFLESRRHTKNFVSPDGMRMAGKEVQELTPFTHIKVRFPDGSAIQGIFKSSEKVGDVFRFVRDNIALKNSEFYLKKLLYRGENLENMDASLVEAQLTPASILVFYFVDGGSANQYLNHELFGQNSDNM